MKILVLTTLFFLGTPFVAFAAISAARPTEGEILRKSFSKTEEEFPEFRALVNEEGGFTASPATSRATAAVIGISAVKSEKEKSIPKSWNIVFWSFVVITIVGAFAARKEESSE